LDQADIDRFVHVVENMLMVKGFTLANQVVKACKFEFSFQFQDGYTLGDIPDIVFAPLPNENRTVVIFRDKNDESQVRVKMFFSPHIAQNTVTKVGWGKETG
jgi:hypothetical protein